MVSPERTGCKAHGGGRRPSIPGCSAPGTGCKDRLRRSGWFYFYLFFDFRCPSFVLGAGLSKVTSENTFILTGI